MLLYNRVSITPQAMTVLMNSIYVAGTVLLLFGAWYNQQADWDYGVSLIMAGLAWYTIPRLSAQNALQIAKSMFYIWFTIDGSYWLYNMARGIDVSDLRPSNLIVSACLYAALAGVQQLRNRV